MRGSCALTFRDCENVAARALHATFSREAVLVSLEDAHIYRVRIIFFFFLFTRRDLGNWHRYRGRTATRTYIPRDGGEPTNQREMNPLVDGLDPLDLSFSLLSLKKRRDLLQSVMSRAEGRSRVVESDSFQIGVDPLNESSFSSPFAHIYR